MSRSGFRILIICMVLLLAAMSCRIPTLNNAKAMLTKIPAMETRVASSIPELETLIPEKTIEKIITTFPELPPRATPSSDVIHLWASSAKASSSLGDTDWSPDQALMEPDTFECGDSGTAWAPRSSDTKDWLELGFAVPVYATQVIIYQSFNPTQITSVQLIEPNGKTHEVYRGDPRDESMNCPYKTVITWDTPLAYMTEKIRITVDQSKLGLGRAEIDAVQLSGKKAEDPQLQMTVTVSETGSEKLPVPPNVDIIASGENSVTYSTSMSLDEVKAFYHKFYTDRGFTQDKNLSIDFKQGFSLVYGGADGFKTIIQATDLGDGKVIVFIQLE